MSGAEPYVLIEQLRVDQRVLSERVLRLEQNAQQGQGQQAVPPAPYMPSARQAARVVPSVRSMARPVPPVPPIAPRGVQQPAAASATPSVLPRDLAGFIGALGSILTAPDATERLMGLADRLGDAVLPLVTKAVREVCPELLDPEPAPAAHAEPAASTLPPVPPIVPAAPSPAAFSVAELGFAPSSVVEFTQVDGPSQS